MFRVEVDGEDGYAYVRLFKADVARTVDIGNESSGVLADLDKDGNVIGIELLYAGGPPEVVLRVDDRKNSYKQVEVPWTGE